MTELWRPVPGFEGFYEASDLGRVRSVPRVITDALGRVRRLQGAVLAPINDRGYLQVSIGRPGVPVIKLRVHVLVASAFLGECPPRHEVCHENGVRSDCRLVNLRYDTKRGNVGDQLRHGTHNQASKTRCPRRHLLVAPNLMPSQLARGRRVCQVCDWARGRIRYDRSLDLQVLADQLYVDLGFDLEERL